MKKLVSINSEVNKLIIKYQTSTKDALESILCMGEAVSQAYMKMKSNEFTKEDLEHFCKSVNLDQKSSTFRKYKAIGDNADRFRQVLDKLPATFSVLYEMATLSGEDFERLVMSRSYSKGITLDQFKKMVQKSVVLTRNKLINRPVLHFSPMSVTKIIRKINQFSISIMRDVSESKFNEIVNTLTCYRNEGLIRFDDPEITEFGSNLNLDCASSEHKEGIQI